MDLSISTTLSMVTGWTYIVELRLLYVYICNVYVVIFFYNTLLYAHLQHHNDTINKLTQW